MRASPGSLTLIRLGPSDHICKPVSILHDDYDCMRYYCGGPVDLLLLDELRKPVGTRSFTTGEEIQSGWGDSNSRPPAPKAENRG